MANNKNTFQLVFPENLKKDANLSTTDALSFDDLGDFIEEREKIKRQTERNLDAKLKVDYSNFSNHVFFDSAVSKFTIANNKILTKYPYNGSLEEKDAFVLTSSDYEEYILDIYPKYVGYVQFTASDQYISASDFDNKLLIGSSSLYVSAWIDQVVSTENIILQYLSSSSDGIKNGYEFYLSGATDVHVKFTLHSGSEEVSVSSSYSAFTGAFHNVAAIYDNAADLLYLYIDENKLASSSVSFGPIDVTPQKLFIASGTKVDSVSGSFDYYSGSLNEIRIAHTASELWHVKNYNRPIDAEPYVKLHYKFNESITGTGSVDCAVVDYSKSGLHGKYLNYDVNGSRVSGTVMLEDPGDPILFSFHSATLAFTASHLLSATLYDNTNNNQIFNIIPEGILEEDNCADQLYQSFALSMARYFDELKLYVDQFVNLRITNYEGTDESPDLFLPFLQKYFGWKVTEHFGETNPLPFFFGEQILASGSLSDTLFDIRNQFWRRTLNNLPYLLKTKGKKSNINAFFNVLGINTNNIKLKEYGFLPGGSLQDTRISKEKPVSLLGIGTGSISSSFVHVPAALSSQLSEWTIEATVQLPFVSASYGFDSDIGTGGIWQVENDGHTQAVSLKYEITNASDGEGRIVLEENNGSVLSSSTVEIFDGDIVHIAAGIDTSQVPFISIKTLDLGELDLDVTVTGSAGDSAFILSASSDFIMGASSGSLFSYFTQGFFGEYRIWNRKLSGSEVEDHALNFQSVGIANPLELPNPLVGHWSLNENEATDSSGFINDILDLSRNGNPGTGSDFPPSENAYDRFLLEYNYLSPSVDLMWNENKIRVHDKTELTIDDVASDTNEISLEFSLIDSLNEDIVKIFSTIDTIHDVIGDPVNKFRDEYADLEALRRVYFARLGDSINFTRFFKLFTWFDKKISDSIKQLLPVRAKFIGGEQVIESHFLERPRHRYIYPIFRTPQEIPETEILMTPTMDGGKMTMLESDSPMMGTTTRTLFDKEVVRLNSNPDSPKVSPRFASVNISGDCSCTPVSLFSDGDERVDRNPDLFFRLKVSGDKKNDVANPNVAVNSRNEFARKTLDAALRDNLLDRSSYINSKLGNGFRYKIADSSKDQEHYFSGYKKSTMLRIVAISGNAVDGSPDSWNFNEEGDILYLTGAGGLDNYYVSASAIVDENDSDFFPRITEFFDDTDDIFNHHTTRFVMEHSRSFTGSVPDSVSINFTVGTPGGNVVFQHNIDGSSTSTPAFIETLDDGWTRTTYDLPPKDRPSFRLDLLSDSGVDDGHLKWFIQTTGTDNVFLFRKFELHLLKNFSNNGVKLLKDIDNQHINKSSTYIRYDALKDVE